MSIGKVGRSRRQVYVKVTVRHRDSDGGNGNLAVGMRRLGQHVIAGTTGVCD